MLVNEPLSSTPLTLRLPVRHLTMAKTRKLVARVAMSESILPTTTTTPFMTPTSTEAPMAIRKPTMSGWPEFTTAYVHSTPDSVMVAVTERSNTPADSGMTRASATNALMALVFMICLAVSHSGKMSGTQIEKITIMTSST